jgi:hypothetical protein
MSVHINRDIRGIVKFSKELRLIRLDLKYIRAHMVDQDMILSPEERTLLEESRQDLRAGKTRSLDDVTRARNRA